MEKAPGAQSPGASALAWPRGLFSLVRYRFFLYAGLIPYFLGAAWAWGIERVFAPRLFWIGLAGIFLSVVGVESFNEYFDARMGTDRVFNPSDDETIPEWMLWLGIAAFALAALLGLYLAREAGRPVLVYACLGGLAAAFYVGPPIRWVYRGLGELMIGLSYGPWMTLGSLSLHARKFSEAALWASLVPGFLIMSLAVVNSVPDYYQDRLVGKNNLVVRLGRKNGVWLYLGLSAIGLALLPLGSLLGFFPKLSAWAALIGLPFWVLSAKAAFKTWDSPRLFIPAVRNIILCYLVSTAAFTLSLLTP